jgi:hypothetical protein
MPQMAYALLTESATVAQMVGAAPPGVACDGGDDELVDVVMPLLGC